MLIGKIWNKFHKGCNAYKRKENDGRIWRKCGMCLLRCYPNALITLEKTTKTGQITQQNSDWLLYWQ